MQKKHLNRPDSLQALTFPLTAGISKLICIAPCASVCIKFIKALPYINSSVHVTQNFLSAKSIVPWVSFSIIVVPLGLALDWVARRLYFTNMGHSEPGLDGAVYSWHRIEMISLLKDQRKTVITSVERPRGLDLDIENGWEDLYTGACCWRKLSNLIRSWKDLNFNIE